MPKVVGGRVVVNVFDKQHPHWESTLAENEEMFGGKPSEPARQAAEYYKRNGIVKILELGAGQGRDAIFFAQQGFKVCALEYTAIGVETIRDKAERLGLSHLVTVIQHDVRNLLPFEDGSQDACYSHMLYCMALTTPELEHLSCDINRVLKKGGFNIYTVRNTYDKHYGFGIRRAEDMYEVSGFIVHFFSQEKVERLAVGYEVIDIARQQEGDLPRELFMVTLRK